MVVNNEAAERKITQSDPDWQNICAKCKDGEIEPKDCEYYGEPNGCNSPIYGEHPTTEKSSAVGNSEVMRDALEQIRDIIMGGSFDGRSPAYIVNICDAALSAKSRNCDVYSHDEALRAWAAEKENEQNGCFDEWLYHTAEEGETDGSK